MSRSTLVSIMCHIFIFFSQPSGKGKRLPEVYCIVSHLGCFNLFSKVNHSSADSILYYPILSLSMSMYNKIMGTPHQLCRNNV